MGGSVEFVNSLEPKPITESYILEIKNKKDPIATIFFFHLQLQLYLSLDQDLTLPSSM